MVRDGCTIVMQQVIVSACHSQNPTRFGDHFAHAQVVQNKARLDLGCFVQGDEVGAVSLQFG